MHLFVAKHPVFMSKAPILEKADKYCHKVRDALRKC